MIIIKSRIFNIKQKFKQILENMQLVEDINLLFKCTIFLNKFFQNLCFLTHLLVFFQILKPSKQENKELMFLRDVEIYRDI